MIFLEVNTNSDIYSSDEQPQISSHKKVFLLYFAYMEQL